MQKIELSTDQLTALGAPQLVYVREVSARDVFGINPPDGVQISPDAILYAVHAANGARLAVLDDRASAFQAARNHDFEPVSVH